MAMTKAAGGVEDLTFGMGIEQQERQFGVVPITQINAGHIPYTLSVSVAQELERLKAVDDAMRNNLDNHVTDSNNPHNIDIESIGGAPLVHTHPISDVNNLQTELNNRAFKQHEHTINDVTGLQTELNGKTNVGDSFLKANHLSESTGSSDAGKPIILDNTGGLHPSISGSGLYLVGYFTPTAGNEYPDISGKQPGAYWAVKDVDDTLGYTIIGGDLAGETVYNDTLMITGEEEWIAIELDLGTDGYYRLDGTIAISAPFAGGQQQLKNIAPATEEGDAVEYGQVMRLTTNFLPLDGTAEMVAPLPMGGFRVIDMANGQDDTDGVSMSQLNEVGTAFDEHATKIDNPHEVTQLQVGLGNVDNTSDAIKPVSGPQQTALNTKVTTEQEGDSIGTTLGNTLIVSEAQYNALTPVADTIYFIVG